MCRCTEQLNEVEFFFARKNPGKIQYFRRFGWLYFLARGCIFFALKKIQNDRKSRIFPKSAKKIQPGAKKMQPHAHPTPLCVVTEKMRAELLFIHQY